MGFCFIALDLSCKTHFLKVLKVLFYFLKGIGSALKPFSPLHSQLKSPQKNAFFKRLSLKFSTD